MNRIHMAGALSLRNPVLVIEPGVTQGQLHDFLQAHCPALSFDMSAAGRDSSVLDHALGCGLGGLARQDLFGLEVVLGSGRLVRTGFRRLGDASPLAHCQPHDTGAVLDGLLLRGGFGIVSSACLKLRVRRPVELHLLFELPREQDLAAFIDVLVGLRHEGVLASVTHIGNRSHPLVNLGWGPCGLAGATLSAAGLVACEWAGLATVSGTPAMVRATVAELRRRVAPWARVRVPGEDGPALCVGTAGQPGGEADPACTGLLCVSPQLPNDGRFVVELLDRMRELARGHGHALHIGLSLVTPTSLVAVTQLQFNQAVPDEVARARHCADALRTLIRAMGLEVCGSWASGQGDPGEQELLALLQRVLDPDDVIAPGRFGPGFA